MNVRAHAASSAADPYAAWAESYPPRAHNPLMEVEQTAVLELLPSVAGLTILDAGCGTGRYTSMLAARGATVLGIDLSQAMLSRTPRGWFIRGDFRSLSLADATFDLVVSGLAIPDVPHLAPVLCEWARVLKVGGLVVCSTLHPRGRELGWTRTFDTPNGSHTLPAFWHTLDDYRIASALAGLSLEAFTEPCLAPSCLRPTPEPVALVVRARRVK